MYINRSYIALSFTSLTTVIDFLNYDVSIRVFSLLHFFGNENFSKLLIRILRFVKVIHCLSFFFQRTKVFSKSKEKVTNDEAFFLVTFYQTENI